MAAQSQCAPSERRQVSMCYHASCPRQCKINYYMLFIFSKGGERGQHHFSAQHFNRGGGSRYTKFLHGRSIFQGPDVIGPIPMEPYTTCDFPLGPGLPAPSRFRPCPESRQCLNLFVVYSLRPNQRYFSYVGTVLPVLNKY